MNHNYPDLNPDAQTAYDRLLAYLDVDGELSERVIELIDDLVDALQCEIGALLDREDRCSYYV